MKGPREDTRAWLEWTLERIHTAPYKVTLRWAFYRAYQGGAFGGIAQRYTEQGLKPGEVKAKLYKNVFIPGTSRARKSFWNGWNPTTLKDDTRHIYNLEGTFFDNVQEWTDYVKTLKPILNPFQGQDSLLFVLFEANAMLSQFKFHLGDKRICLVPFGGEATIELKWNVAKAIEDAVERWKKPARVFYFGDKDDKGEEIPENALRDIHEWCNADFEYYRVGINAEHIKKYDLPDNPEKPGTYQWEALDETASTELISEVLKYWREDKFNKLLKVEEKAGGKWKNATANIILKDRGSRQ